MKATNSNTHILEVWGDFACFSRPELAVERYSYPCPTPSATRGVFEAIYFKPEFYWQVTRIELLNSPNYIALRRNEVKDKISESAVKKWINGTTEVEPLFADADKSMTGTDQKGRTQRQTMALKTPHYRLHAQIVPRSGNESELNAYNSQFVRRASQGKCFQQPYLGCREFIAFFRLIENAANEPKSCDYSQDLGFMLYDVFDIRSNNHEIRYGGKEDNWKQMRPTVSIFKARIESGVLDVPPIGSDKILKSTLSVGRDE
ncbi:MAG: type I-C CRISPR-associated protein Cas5 [Pirellulaceae bacterium]|nr:type I-C CRISPR-associated protein Cas5 [Pirellulaceae bacterium]